MSLHFIYNHCSALLRRPGIRNEHGAAEWDAYSNTWPKTQEQIKARNIPSRSPTHGQVQRYQPNDPPRIRKLPLDAAWLRRSPTQYTGIDNSKQVLRHSGTDCTAKYRHCSRRIRFNLPLASSRLTRQLVSLKIWWSVHICKSIILATTCRPLPLSRSKPLRFGVHEIHVYQEHAHRNLTRTSPSSYTHSNTW
jgi:hypothetical protein